ncbi:CGNR zinc finger domain-containing protein [Streptomyces sp. NPDC093089]|uniref:CGNR zinc finger domain-containing protein n=1 Tax=Streptomyces sp. NPDC093089 TaxID=3366024 RepID=UPI003824D3E9
MSWREKVLDRQLADLPLEDLAELRAPVGRAARGRAAGSAAGAGGGPAQRTGRAAPVTFRGDDAGHLTEQEAGGPVAAAVAGQALVPAAGPERARLRRCPAPSCGMCFLARGRDQAWCSIGCGKRARAARRSEQCADMHHVFLCRNP